MNALIIAEALAKHMAKGTEQNEPPEVEEINDGSAQFAIDTPMGRFRIDVTEV